MKKKTILIPTIRDDIHAAAVAILMESIGHRPIRWFCSDYPERSTSSFAISSSKPSSVEFHDYFGDVALDEIDIFWNRRVGAPIYKSFIAECDKDMATEETNRFVAGVLSTVSNRVFSVNDYHAARNAENKLAQLACARTVGLTIPDTLITNDPQKIRHFITSHLSNGVIYKPFKPAIWESDGNVAIVYTSTVQLDDLPEDEVLKLSPAIFQEQVPKTYELRVTCMGHEVVTAQLNSQATTTGRVDWRMASEKEMCIERVTIPKTIEHKCRAMLDSLGLVFGCFDFVVTPSGEYVFLEVNQMGQFLWIEDVNPEIPLLQMFCDFLISGNGKFVYSKKKSWLSFSDIRNAAEKMIYADRDIHPQAERFPHSYRE